MSKLIRFGPVVMDLDSIAYILDEIDVPVRQSMNKRSELHIYLLSGDILPLKDEDVKNAFRSVYYEYKGQPERIMQTRVMHKTETQNTPLASNPIDTPKPVPGLPQVNYDRVRSPIIK